MQPWLICVQCSGQPKTDCPGRGDASPYIKVSSNCLLLRLSRPAVFHTVRFSQPGGLEDQTDYQQGHSAPLLSPAVVVGCKRLRDVPTRSGYCDRLTGYVMQRLAHDVWVLFCPVQPVIIMSSVKKQQTLVTVIFEAAPVLQGRFSSHCYWFIDPQGESSTMRLILFDVFNFYQQV